MCWISCIYQKYSLKMIETHVSLTNDDYGLPSEAFLGRFDNVVCVLLIVLFQILNILSKQSNDNPDPRIYHRFFREVIPWSDANFSTRNLADVVKLCDHDGQWAWLSATLNIEQAIIKAHWLGVLPCSSLASLVACELDQRYLRPQPIAICAFKSIKTLVCDKPKTAKTAIMGSVMVYNIPWRFQRNSEALLIWLNCVRFIILNFWLQIHRCRS